MGKYPGNRSDQLRRMDYEEYLKTPEWYTIRRLKLEQAGKSCQMCDSEGPEIHVHHRTYKRRGRERLSDLIVLCADCHEKFHDDGKRSGRSRRSRVSGGREAVGDTGPLAERDLLLLAVRSSDGEVVEKAQDAGITPGSFTNETYATIYEAFCLHDDRVSVSKHAEEGGAKETLARLIDSSTELTHPDEIFERCVARLKNRPRFRRLREIDHELEAFDSSDPDLVQERQEIARELREDGVPMSFIHRWTNGGQE